MRTRRWSWRRAPRWRRSSRSRPRRRPTRCSSGSAWTASRAGVPERWGFRGSGRAWMLTRDVRRPRGRVHQVDYYRALVHGIGLDAPAAAPRLAPRPATLERADRLLRGAGIASGATLVG